MNPSVLSPTTQQFLGVKYYKKRLGYYESRGPGERMLHRAVWRFHHSNIPHGWHVHHKDDDRGNCEYENLTAMAPLDHRRLHFTSEVMQAKGALRGTVTITCTQCGEVAELANNGTGKYCSPLCRERARVVRDGRAHINARKRAAYARKKANVPPQA